MVTDNNKQLPLQKYINAMFIDLKVENSAIKKFTNFFSFRILDYKQIISRLNAFYDFLQSNPIISLSIGSLINFSDVQLIKLLVALLYIKINFYSMDAEKKNNLSNVLVEFAQKHIGKQEIADEELIPIAKKIKNSIYPDGSSGIDYKKTIIDILTEFS
ncbi:MAG: hypothetical protein ACOYNH_12710, partial [Bacteroidia bacterium]